MGEDYSGLDCLHAGRPRKIILRKVGDLCNDSRQWLGAAPGADAPFVSQGMLRPSASFLAALFLLGVSSAYS